MSSPTGCAPACDVPRALGTPSALVAAGGVAANQAIRTTPAPVALRGRHRAGGAAAGALHRQRRDDRLGRRRAAGARADRSRSTRRRRALAARRAAARRQPRRARARAPDSAERRMTFAHIGVVGGGAWGTALANVAARAGRAVTLWEHEPAMPRTSRTTRESLFLPGVRIDDGIVIARDLAKAARAQALLLVVPAQAMRAATAALAPLSRSGMPLIVCAKGIERGTCRFMSEVIAEGAPERGNRDAVGTELRGRRRAGPADRGDACSRRRGGGAPSSRARSARRPSGPIADRPARRRDRRRRQERACDRAGIVAGRGLGASAAAALITRGFAELCRFGQRLWRAAGDADGPLRPRRPGADLLSPQSRNFSFGVALGKGQSPDQVRAGASLRKARSPPRCCSNGARQGVEMPIAAAVAGDARRAR